MIGQTRVFRVLYLAVCLFMIPVAVAAQASQKEYAENFHEPFKGQPLEKAGDFVLLGADAGQCVKFEPEGLRITLPPGKKRQAIGLATAFGATGDFEITIGYEILQEPEPADAGDGGGTRISLTVNLNKPGTNLIAIRRRVTTTQEPRILTWRSVKKDATSKADELGKTFLVKAKTGRFRLVRTGVDLAYYLSEGADKEFTLLQTFALGADEVKDVQIFASSTSETASLDARFTDLRISAASLPRKPGPAKIEKVSESKIPIKEYAQTYNYSFRGASKISHEYEFSGPDGERYVKLDSAGLHVNLAKGEPAIGSHHGLIANLLIKGDFEITVGFELANEPAPQGDKWGTGISIAVNLDTPEKNRAFLSRVTRWDSKMFGTYVDFWPPGADKPLKPFHSFPAHTAAGRLRIVRSRTQVSYFVSEGADRDFRFLRTDPFRPDDVKQIHIAGTVGGPEASLDALVIDLHVRAAEVTVPHMPAAAPPREGRRGWWLAGLLLALIPISVLTLVFFLRKRGGVARQIPT